MWLLGIRLFHGIYIESILGSTGESNIEKKRKKKRARDRFGEKRKEAQEN